MRTAILFQMAILLFLTTACRSSQKMVEQGDYDTAIRQSVQRLAGKKKKKAKEVNALQIALNKANSQDIERIEQLKRANRSENWERIYDLATNIEKRQDRIQPLLPLMDDRGRTIDFRFVKVNGILQEARGKASEHLYDLALTDLARARRGDKLAAREAFENLERSQRYLSPYKDRKDLIREALELGTNHILLTVRQDGRAILSAAFERELLRLNVADLNDRWRIYHTQERRDEQYDYEVVVQLERMDVSPESLRERSYRDEKEIESGSRKLLDDTGKEVKDSSGNVITVPIIKVISADVLEVYQSKAATVSGRLLFYNRKTKQLIDSESITAEANFENYAVTFRGDRQALSNESRRLIGNSPRDFPSDEALLLDAADVLKPILMEKIKRVRLGD